MIMHSEMDIIGCMWIMYSVIFDTEHTDIIQIIEMKTKKILNTHTYARIVYHDFIIFVSKMFCFSFLFGYRNECLFVTHIPGPEIFYNTYTAVWMTYHNTQM